MKNIDFILESDEALKPSERLVLLLLEKHRMLYTNDLLALSNLSYKNINGFINGTSFKIICTKGNRQGKKTELL